MLKVHKISWFTIVYEFLKCSYKYKLSIRQRHLYSFTQCRIYKCVFFFKFEKKYSLVALIPRTKVTRLTQMAKKEDAKNQDTIGVYFILRSEFFFLNWLTITLPVLFCLVWFFGHNHTSTHARSQSYSWQYTS